MYASVISTLKMSIALQTTQNFVENPESIQIYGPTMIVKQGINYQMSK